ncbi:MAG TPA: 5'-nucleotidase C-terminal domain-containing protein [Gemmatimonadaceae bacterium]|jgi:2',3'-cyclic-nucleotide 2'-phosphodiesterase (5'-nucleotidase family)
MMHPLSLGAVQRRAPLLAFAALAIGCATPTSRFDLRSTRLTRINVPPSPHRSEVDLVVAATTDTHGRLRSWDYYANAPEPERGLTRLATIVDSLRGANPGRVVLVDAGDLLQGNPLTYVAARLPSSSLRPHPVAAAMNAMSYDAAAIGNHEFNYGVPTLRRMIADARFPMLAANAYSSDGHHAFTAWKMIVREGVRIGLVGGTTPGSNVWDRDNLAGRIVVRDIIPSVRESVAAARAAGADVVIVMLHSGLNEPSSYDTVSTKVASENVTARVAREVPGIDLIVYGHSHKELADSMIDGALLMQPKNWATSLGVATLRLAREGAHWRVVEKHSTLIPAAGHAENAVVIAATEAAHKATLAYATQPVGTTIVAWRADSARVLDTPLIDFILDVERKATGAQLASTAAFSLDANLAAGPVTVARIAALYPYDNTLRKIRISGRQLRDYLEFSARYFRTDAHGVVGVDPSIPGYNFDIVGGANYTIDVSKPIGARITRLEYQGRLVAPTDSFTFALNNYRQTGGGGYAMLAGSKNLDDRQLEIRQLLIDEVRARKTLDPSEYARHSWEIVPNAAVATAYASMHRIPGEGATRTAARPAIAGRRLRLIGTNDVHGALEPRPDANGVLRGGLAYVAAAIQRAEAECKLPQCTALLLDGGDEFQGTPASNFAFGRPVVDVFNQLGLAAGALGNHEFDWGQDTLRARMRQAHYAILGANVRDTLGHAVPWIRSDTLIRRGGIEVGVIGLATRSTPTSTRASNVVGLRFDDPAPIVDSLTRRLRANGADVVVVVAHAGAFCDRTGRSGCAGEIVDLAQRLSQHVDAIISGHTHSLVNTLVHGTPIVQGRSQGQAIDVVDLPLDAPEGTMPAHDVRDVLPDSIAPDSAINALVAQATSAAAPRANRPIARVAEYMKKSATGAEEQVALGNLIADAMRVEGNGDIGIMNNGGIRAPLRAGTATYGDLFEVQPFGNILYRVTVGGRDLRSYFENLLGKRRPIVHISGAVLEYDTTRAPGSRLVSVRIGDSPLDENRSYTVVLNDFEYTGGSGLGFGSAVRRAENLDLVDLDAFIRYLQHQQQPVASPNDKRFVIAPRP